MGPKNERQLSVNLSDKWAPPTIATYVILTNVDDNQADFWLDASRTGDWSFIRLEPIHHFDRPLTE